jgi:cysteine synthase
MKTQEQQKEAEPALGVVAGSAARGTPASIAKRLRWLSHRMQSVGAEMEYYGGFGEIGDHGREMQGAASIAFCWAKGIEASLANTRSSATPNHGR